MSVGLFSFDHTLKFLNKGLLKQCDLILCVFAKKWRWILRDIRKLLSIKSLTWMEENVPIYLSAGVSLNGVDPACEEIANAGPPEDYSELTQNNFCSIIMPRNDIQRIIGPYPTSLELGALD